MGDFNGALSASKVDCFNNCERLFKYRYITKPIEEPPKLAFAIGNLAHQALEYFYKNIPVDQADQWPMLMGECVRASFNKIDQQEAELLKLKEQRQVKKMLQNYLNHLRSLPCIPKVFSLEKFFRIAVQGVPISGKADRIDELGQLEYDVVDYKSSKRASSVAAVYKSVQLPTYALWLRETIGPKVKVHGTYNYLRLMDKPEGVDRHLVTDAWIEDAIEQYVEIYDKINTKGYDFPKNLGFQWHKYCEYKDYCEGDDD